MALDLSVRQYARRQPLAASSVTRYLNGMIVPPWEFVDDLLHEVEQHRGKRNPAHEGRLKDLHQAAQDGEVGGWGLTKKLRADLARSIARAEAAEAERDALASSQRSLQNQLAAALARLDQDHPDQLLIERDELVAEQERLRFELSMSQLLIKAAIDEARELRQELAQLGGAADESGRPTAWAPWYSPQTTNRRTYWRQCAAQLQADGWTPQAVESMDAASDRIVGSLADPTGPLLQAKGIVFTTFQGGTSGHVAGVMTKAVDAGYRMVILLSGPLNVMRQQLQQRIDSLLPTLPDTFGIIRLTSAETDYQRLTERLSELEFEKWAPDEPLNDPSNLDRASVRLMIVKRNASVLTKLIGDLTAIKTPLDEIPALVIDVAAEVDPSDHGSVLSNKAAQLLAILPRAQFIAFTADPFARLDSRLGGGRSHLADFAVSLPHPSG